MQYQDIRYEVENHVAWVAIDRPEVRNALRPNTVLELSHAMREAWDDADVGVVVLTGTGDKAFCAGADLSAPELQTPPKPGPDGKPGRRSGFLLGLADLESSVRSIPKPVVASVNGMAMGGGGVLNLLCDLSIASETATFGQAGPKVGKVDPGWGTAYLSRAIGEKKAREMWMLCRIYTAQQALDMGLVNTVVPPDTLREETRKWCDELLSMSPTALTLAKQSFNADSASIQGLSYMGMMALDLLWDTDESVEGLKAFREKRRPEYDRYRSGK